METVTNLRQIRPLPELLNRKAKAKQHWPNPQDSVGDLIGLIGRQKCWRATGPARTTFLDASRAIKEFLDRHTETTSCWVTWSIYMVGDTKDTAVPTIIFCSESEAYRKAIRDRVKKRGVLDKYPPGISLKHLPRAPDYRQLVQLASGPYNRHDTHMESAPCYVYSTSRWPSLGDRLWIGPSLVSLRKATAGGTIKVDGVDLLMTAAHPFDPIVEPSTYNPSMEKMCFSDSEDYSDCLSEESFNSYSSQYEAKANGELGSSDAPGADPEGLMDHLNHESPEEPHRYSTPANDGIDEDLSKYASTKKAQILPDYELVGSLVFSSSKHSDHGQALDYSLIRFHFDNDAVKDDLESSSSSGLFQFPDHVPREAYHTRTSTTVVNYTASAGIVTGSIVLTPVYMRVPDGTTYQEVYTVSLENPLSDGDCGSWVYDTHMRLLGHIIAGSPDTRTAFVVPAFEVFDDIRSMVHAIRAQTGFESRQSSLQPAQNLDNVGKDFDGTRPPLSAPSEVTSLGYHHDRLSLISQPDFSDDRGSVPMRNPREAPARHTLNYLQKDTMWRKLKAEYIEYWTKQMKYSDAFDAEEAKDKEKQDTKKLKDLKAKEVEYTHRAHVSELYVDAREAELKANVREAKRLQSLAREEEQEWAKNHPAPKKLGVESQRSQGANSAVELDRNLIDWGGA